MSLFGWRCRACDVRLYSLRSLAKVPSKRSSCRREIVMGYDKGHKEFYGVDMKEGFHTEPGYP